jgi:hypothetical protein
MKFRFPLEGLGLWVDFVQLKSTQRLYIYRLGADLYANHPKILLFGGLLQMPLAKITVISFVSML